MTWKTTVIGQWEIHSCYYVEYWISSKYLLRLLPSYKVSQTTHTSQVACLLHLPASQPVLGPPAYWWGRGFLLLLPPGRATAPGFFCLIPEFSLSMGFTLSSDPSCAHGIYLSPPSLPILLQSRLWTPDLGRCSLCCSLLYPFPRSLFFFFFLRQWQSFFEKVKVKHTGETGSVEQAWAASGLLPPHIYFYGSCWKVFLR